MFSLPNYRRLSDADLDRLRRDNDRNSSSSVARILFNLLLLAGLWGVPLYARWMLLADVIGAESLPKAILGEWWDDRHHGEWWNADKAVLEFTTDQQIRLFWGKALIETANYRIVGNTLEVSNFIHHPDGRHLTVNSQHYQITIYGNRLNVSPSTTGFTPVPENAAEEWSGLRSVLPTSRGAFVRFWRRDKR